MSAIAKLALIRAKAAVSDVRLAKIPPISGWVIKAVIVLALLAMAHNYAQTNKGWFLKKYEEAFTLLIERKIVKGVIQEQDKAEQRVIENAKDKLEKDLDFDTRNWNKAAADLPAPQFDEPAAEPVEPAPAPVADSAIVPRYVPTVRVGPISEGPVAEPTPPARSKKPSKLKRKIQNVREYFKPKPSYARDLNRAEHDANSLLYRSTKP